MAETIVSLLVHYLVPLLTEEAQLLRGVHGDIAGIIRELQLIQIYLKDADARAESSDVARTYVKQVREQAYHIEDVIDEYIIHVANNQQRNKIAKFLRNVARLAIKLKTHHVIGPEIRAIKESIQEIYNTSIRCGFTPSARTSDGIQRNHTLQDHRVLSLFVDEGELVGIESPRNELIGWLDEKVPQRSVISVVGMGGIGKTTLAKRVYDSRTSTPMTHFDCHAWVIVSKLYHEVELLRSMINQFYKSRNEAAPNAIETMDLRSLWTTIQKYLQKKRYVVLFDDVWQPAFWSFIKNVLPNNEDCKIILTTQIQNIAKSCLESRFDHIYPVQPLTEEQSWELFCKKAFRIEFGGYCPSNLAKQSRQIVKKCEGLPLAIVAVGSLLSTMEKDVSKWRMFHDNLGTSLGSDPGLNTIAKILSLSYNDLPCSYKLCFLYFGLFPEDYPINCRRLIKLWIAEGFLKRDGAKTLEEIGEEYLNELVQRNLVQVSMVNFVGKFKKCRVHHLMRGIIMLKSEELSFCEVLDEHNSISVRKDRRLSIQCDIDSAVQNIGNPMTRSIFVFKVERLPNNFMATVCATFKLLKVLDSQDAPLENLPKEVGDLFHLRYLSIRGTKIKKLPKSIGKLHNLETLDMKHTHVHELPTQISGLFNLRHLLAGNSLGGVKIQDGFRCLQALQKLYYVEASHVLRLVTELQNLRQLIKLGIIKLMTTHCHELCLSIEKMPHLQSLHIASLSEDEIIDLQSVKYPPYLLEDICLKGCLVTLPDWVATLKNLAKLYLISSRLLDDPLKVLQTLPQLSLLGLHQAYDGAELYFEAGGFQQLKRLELTDLKELNMMKIENGALPILEELNIGPSPKMKEVPSNIQCLGNLTTLTFVDMPKEFIYNILPHEGRDFRKVEHIPVVLVNQENEGTYHTRTLIDMRKEYYS